MPELPDLLYIQSALAETLAGSSVEDVVIQRPVVLRNNFEQSPSELLRGRSLIRVMIAGPFIILSFVGDVEVIINLMLAGRLQLQHHGEKPLGYRCCSIAFTGGVALHLSDDQTMAKVYLIPAGSRTLVPALTTQGVDIMSSDFTPEAFCAICKAHARKQVRVMINNHSILSSIGNAYADEILFEAGIHPKTLVGKLLPPEVDRLHQAIGSVITWGTEMVRNAHQPIHVKVREHMRVRNRHGSPCPRCGTTIRRAGVRGHDVYFCPQCQPATRRQFIDWNGKAEASRQALERP